MGVEEFCGGESLTQRAAFLAPLTRDFPGIRTSVHDDACQLRKFMDRWVPNFPELRFPNLDFVVDKFHAAGHTDDWRKATCCPRAASTILVRARSFSPGARSTRALSGA